ncbi:translocation/assembly module TamB domain-containing protein [Anaeromyxobacter paludicola]|nr:translocation/assembly module TamB domain-containing protein [Anaeromyxobacter paludicola]
MSAVRKLAAALGLALAAAAALAGLALGAVYLALDTEPGRALVLPRAVRAVDDAIAGSVAVGRMRLLPGAGAELEGVRIVDPDGDEVLRVERLRLTLDVSKLLSRTVGVRVELERPEVLLKREPDGGLSLARAFAPTHPSPPKAGGGRPALTVRLERLILRGGIVRYQDAAGAVAFAAQDVSLDARGAWQPRGEWGEVRLRGELTAPVRAAAALDLSAAVRGDQLLLPLLRAQVGGTALDLVAEGDLRAQRGRAGLLAWRVDARELRALAPRSPLPSDLSGWLYAESNGSDATAALEVTPASGAGRARGAAAVHLPPGTLAGGFDLAVEALDPSRLFAPAPPGALTLSAEGRATGTTFETLRGALALHLAPSRLRDGRLGPGEVRATARDGLVEVSRLDLAAPGLSLHATGRYDAKGAVAGRGALASPDLALASRNGAALAGVPPPPLRGSAAVEAAVSGTAAAPRLTLAVTSPELAHGAVSAGGLTLSAAVAGPLAKPTGSVQGKAERLTAGRLDARALSLSGTFDGRDLDLSLGARVPDLGPDPLDFRVAGALQPGGAQFVLRDLHLAFPGTRYALTRPATVDLTRPAVDRLELASGGARIALEGGLAAAPPATPEKALDARLAVSGFDLSTLPARLLPPGLDLGGRLSASATARGPLDAPLAVAHVSLEDGRFRKVGGVRASADLRYEGAARRAELALDLSEASGTTLSLTAGLPTDLARARDDARLAARVRLAKLSLATAQALAGREPVATGVASLDLDLAGTVGAPALTGRLRLDRVQAGEWGPASARLDADGRGGKLALTLAADLFGAHLLDARGSVPVRLASILRAPGPELRRVRAGGFQLDATVPGYELALLGGKGSVPASLGGTLSGKAALAGTFAAPRGAVELSVRDGRLEGYRELDLAARLATTARPDGAEATARLALAGGEVARLAARLGLPPERLSDAAALGRAPLRVELTVPRNDLARAGAIVPVAGEVEGRALLEGSLDAPRAELALAGRRLAVKGNGLGDLRLAGRYAAGKAQASADLAAAQGGTLSARLSADADLSLPSLRRKAWREAPAEASVVADRLDLGFLPAVVPDLVRSAGGKLGADVVARGPLGKLRPLGTARVVDGRVAVAELGEWTRIEADASLSEDLFKLSRLEARRGAGRLELTAEAVGLSRPAAPADVTLRLGMRDLTLSRAGQDLATVDLDARGTGSWRAGELKADVTVPQGTVRLPKRSPRKLQPLEERADIVVGHPRKGQAGAAAEGEAPPLHALVHLLVPNRFFVKSDNPKLDIELKADAQFEYQDEELTATGGVETVRGFVEPIGGKVFNLQRGKVTFTGASPQEAALDVAATWQNPTAKVNVHVSGTPEEPKIALTSEPPLDESQIAILIATGRTELKPGAGGVGTLTGDEAGRAALGAAATLAFKEVLADKLPIDSVSLDSSQLRAGKYVTDKIYVGYTRRFTVSLDQAENTNEVRVEYQITPRWTFESSYGDANAGAASLIWSKDY